jgi:hypothetical protein
VHVISLGECESPNAYKPLDTRYLLAHGDVSDAWAVWRVLQIAPREVFCNALGFVMPSNALGL